MILKVRHFNWRDFFFVFGVWDEEELGGVRGSMVEETCDSYNSEIVICLYRFYCNLLNTVKVGNL